MRQIYCMLYLSRVCPCTGNQPWHKEISVWPSICSSYPWTASRYWNSSLIFSSLLRWNSSQLNRFSANALRFERVSWWEVGIYSSYLSSSFIELLCTSSCESPALQALYVLSAGTSWSLILSILKYGGKWEYKMRSLALLVILLSDSSDSTSTHQVILGDIWVKNEIRSNKSCSFSIYI